MTRKNASSKSSSDIPIDNATNNLSPDAVIEQEEREGRRALSLSIMHHALAASNVKTDVEQPEALQSIRKRSGMNGATSAFGESDYSVLISSEGGGGQSLVTQEVAKKSSSLAAFALNERTRIRRVCMFVIALVLSVVVALVFGSQRLGFTSLEVQEEAYGMQEEEGKVHYTGNYSDTVSKTGGGLATTHQSDEGGYSYVDTFTGVQNTYQVPDTVDMTDDYVKMDTILPPSIEENLVDMFDMTNGNAVPMFQDVPFFWLIPRSGGNSVRYIMSYCHQYVVACEVGRKKEDVPVLEVFEEAGARYVNVDTETSRGIQRAASLNLIDSGMAYAIFSTKLYEMTELFNMQHRGRMFTVLRHPVDRSLSTFYNIQARNPKLSSKSITQFLDEGHKLEDNLMVRSLINKPEAGLTSYDLEMAVAILKRKFLIGLVDEMPESIRRFKLYFGWKNVNLQGVDQCENTFVSPSPRRKPSVTKDSKPWQAIVQLNEWDMKLYDFALHLFDVQGLYLSKLG